MDKIKNFLEKIEKPLVTISIVASIIAVILSFHTASNDIRLSLFEEKYETYKNYSLLINNANKAQEMIDSEEIETSTTLWISLMSFLIPDDSIMELDIFKEEKVVSGEEAKEVYLYVFDEISKYCNKLEYAKYVFALTDKEKESIETIIITFDSFTYDDLTTENLNSLDSKIEQLLETINSTEILSAMESQLGTKSIFIDIFS